MIYILKIDATDERARAAGLEWLKMTYPMGQQPGKRQDKVKEKQAATQHMIRKGIDPFDFFIRLQQVEV